MIHSMAKQKLLVSTAIFLLSAIVFGQFGFKGELTRDEAIYMYSGQQFAHGVAPYASIFDHKGPMASIITGFGVVVANWCGFDDLTTVRVLFYFICCLTAVALYFFSIQLFGSSRLGWFAVSVLYTYWEFGRKAMSGPRAKVPMVLFQIISLHLIAKKKWFWAGLWCSITALVWQPTGVLGVFAVVLAFFQAEEHAKRVNNVLKVIVGASIPVVLISAYFCLKGAFFDFIDGYLIFNLSHIERTEASFWQHIQYPLISILKGYPIAYLSILLSFVMMGLLLAWRLKLNGNSFSAMVKKDSFAIVVLSCPVYIIWSFIDFQGPPDFYVLIPYSAIGFAWLLNLAMDGVSRLEGSATEISAKCSVMICLILVGVSAFSYRVWSDSELVKQKQKLEYIVKTFAPRQKIATIGIPEIPVLLKIKNPNRYLFVINGVDNNIDARFAGGFKGWMNSIASYDPDFIAVGSIRSKYNDEVVAWLERGYIKKRFGDWNIYVKNDPFQQLK